jgi:hypothetical protein
LQLRAQFFQLTWDRCQVVENLNLDRKFLSVAYRQNIGLRAYSGRNAFVGSVAFLQ